MMSMASPRRLLCPNRRPPVLPVPSRPRCRPACLRVGLLQQIPRWSAASLVLGALSRKNRRGAQFSRTPKVASAEAAPRGFVPDSIDDVTLGIGRPSRPRCRPACLSLSAVGSRRPFLPACPPHGVGRCRHAGTRRCSRVARLRPCLAAPVRTGADVRRPSCRSDGAGRSRRREESRHDAEGCD